MDPGLSLPACLMADNSEMWMLDNQLDLSGIAEVSLSFEDRWPTNKLALPPPQRAQKDEPTHGGWRVWAVID